MNKKIITSFLFLTSISTNAAFAENSSNKIIYGVDNRIETYQGSERDQKLASATAGMLEASKLIDLGENALLPPKSISRDIGLCGDERFSQQPASTICSGFLVGPNLMVTAGHCVGDQKRCEEVKFVFDYKIEEDTKRAKMIIPKSKVFSCKRVIDAKLEGDQDYSLIELDRIVEGVQPLKYRTRGMIETGKSIMVIGHPSGLPQKIAAGAKVFVNRKNAPYFKTNLDTYGGNSGSAVFDSKTGIVEGILVRGAKDYVEGPLGGCIVSNQAVNNINGKVDLGESVTRISEIPALKLRHKLFQAVRENDIKAVISLLSIGADISMKDNSSLTSIELAKLYNNKEMVKVLSSKKYTSR